MASAYTQSFYHIVFGAEHRAHLITPELEQRHGIEFDESKVFQ